MRRILYILTVFLLATQAHAVSATGGTITNYTDAGGTNWTAHIFTSDDTLVVTADGTIEYLVVAGGGGGGGGYNGAGGGAGGIRIGSTNVTATSYTITVGSGGNGNRRNSAAAETGTCSTVVGGSINLTTTGGGYGGSEDYVYGGFRYGVSGGSGGGTLRTPGSFGGAAVGGGELGYRGGNNGDSDAESGAGGGGAGSVGALATSPHPPDGGSGYSSAISGSTVTYSAGGNGAHRSSNSDGASAADNTGDGGAGGGKSTGNALGGTGGSGIVIVRYVASDTTATPAYLFAPNNIFRKNLAMKNQETQL